MRSNISGPSTLWITAILLTFTASGLSQENRDYPSPRYPQLRKVTTAKALLDIARTVVRRPSRGASLYPGYGIEPGQRALIVVDSQQDRLVVEAIEMAIREAGGKPDVFYIDYASFNPPMEPADGKAELEYFTFLADNVMRSKIFVAQLANAVGEYDIIIHGAGGADPEVDVKWEKMPWQTVDEFISGTVEFPPRTGGGAYGESWKALLEKYKNVQWPGSPGPGMGWLYEVAIGTNPKASRPANVMNDSRRIWSWERARTGIIHWGMGVVGGALPGGPISRWANERDLPEGHFHVHTYFTTFEIETEDGEKIKVIDKGHLTALDDPKIRELAAQYGDPDELLQEGWIPAIPGINVAGDYWRDYANNPAPWITKEHQEAYGEWLQFLNSR